jgi:voltage-gated potassium channel
MLVAALLVIPALVIEEFGAGAAWQAVGVALNWTIWLAFAIEAGVMLAVVPQRGRWLLRHPLEVAIVLLTPPFLPASFQTLRAFRLFRLIPLLRLGRVARRLFSLEGVRWAALLATLTALFAGAAYSLVEDGASTWDGVWWAISTMTTVGYGDEFPVTTLGRTLGMALMLVGVGLIAVLTGAVAERFVATRINESEAELAGELEESELGVVAELQEIGRRLQALERRLGAAELKRSAAMTTDAPSTPGSRGSGTGGMLSVAEEPPPVTPGNGGRASQRD